MKPKKPRKPEVVEVRFRLLTTETNASVREEAEFYALRAAYRLGAKLTKRPTVERVGKR